MLQSTQKIQRFRLPWRGIGVLALFFFPESILAHNLGAECRLKGNGIEVEAYYDTNDDAVGARVRVLDSKGKEVAGGAANAKGRWSVALLLPGKYQVLVETPGHKAILNIEVPLPWPLFGASSLGLASVSPEPLLAAWNASPGRVPPLPEDMQRFRWKTPSRSFPGDPLVISDGPTRQEFTRFPWIKMVLGLGIIGSVSAAFLWARRKGRKEEGSLE